MVMIALVWWRMATRWRAGMAVQLSPIETEKMQGQRTANSCRSARGEAHPAEGKTEGGSSPPHTKTSAPAAPHRSAKAETTHRWCPQHTRWCCIWRWP
ncbi:unnamed protein product [Vitrella brassicaformis CCMP3155]|uniref:Secreted protein n=1 Tax=Vitrella brassicaformis (strain CCMP3155) TaxID=1169540 RepID=A0A0G4EF53_VITBC|nr:unnamed protein product [Vitrella brassicaformis CCMP3155]|eukprot:CEL94364.1 unnamed protein product [Vitrella brassicaformis CCMP3155]